MDGAVAGRLVEDQREELAVGIEETLLPGANTRFADFPAGRNASIGEGVAVFSALASAQFGEFLPTTLVVALRQRDHLGGTGGDAVGGHRIVCRQEDVDGTAAAGGLVEDLRDDVAVHVAKALLPGADTGLANVPAGRHEAFEELEIAFAGRDHAEFGEHFETARIRATRESQDLRLVAVDIRVQDDRRSEHRQSGGSCGGDDDCVGHLEPFLGERLLKSDLAHSAPGRE